VRTNDEQKNLHDWQSLHPGASTSKVTSEAFGFSPTKITETTISTSITTAPVVLGYNPDEPHMPMITSEGGMSLVSPVFEKAQRSPAVVANFFLILSHDTDQPPIDPWPVRVLV